ncbi:hypothetical protein CK220_10980 [Mesorhizobium sp. WSM3860]|nr:hypothetical protein CK220_10980 [Mesorhizobium sp. WSM3860]
MKARWLPFDRRSLEAAPLLLERRDHQVVPSRVGRVAVLLHTGRIVVPTGKIVRNDAIALEALCHLADIVEIRKRRTR